MLIKINMHFRSFLFIFVINLQSNLPTHVIKYTLFIAITTAMNNYCIFHIIINIFTIAISMFILTNIVIFITTVNALFN